MTEREFTIHEKMRQLKKEVSAIKRHIRHIEAERTRGSPQPTTNQPTSQHSAYGTSPEWLERERTRLRARLDELRLQWKQLDQERIDAAMERMRRLGHISE